MNVFTLHNLLAYANGNKVNIISNDVKGYRVMTINGRNEINEMNGKNYKYYTSLSDAIKSSQIRSNFFPVFQIIAHGTDFANAEIIKQG